MSRIEYYTSGKGDLPEARRITDDQRAKQIFFLHNSGAVSELTDSVRTLLPERGDVTVTVGEPFLATEKEVDLIATWGGGWFDDDGFSWNRVRVSVVESESGFGLKINSDYLIPGSFNRQTVRDKLLTAVGNPERVRVGRLERPSIGRRQIKLTP